MRITELKKTLSILKARWPEAALIIFFPLLAQTLSWLTVWFRQFPAQLLVYIMSGSGLLIVIILIFLNSGFLRTVYLHDSKRQSVPVLFKTGWHFFWRILLFNLLYSVLFSILVLLIMPPITKHVSPQISSMIHRLSINVFNLILIKIKLLIPILIIVLDCGFFESFKLLKHYKLSKAKVLIILFLVNVAIGFFWVFIPGFGPNLNFILTLTNLFIVQFIWLMIGVTAVRFVSSVDLMRDNRTISQYPENEPE